MLLSSGVYANTPLNTTAMSQALLNIEEKLRSNPLPWNGQFSPQLIEALIKQYASSDTVLLDPFVGSGTVLYEAGLAGIKAYGVEINPAAIILSKIYTLINVAKKFRKEIIGQISTFLVENFSETLPLFQREALAPRKDGKALLLEFLANINDPLQKNLFEAFIVLLDFYNHETSAKHIFLTWNRVIRLVTNLPYSAQKIEVFHADARRIPLPTQTINLVITSPPYINVFNYHQRYRTSVEALQWNLLEVAKSEFGANRKHRSNRYLTVIQYALDIAQTFQEIGRLCMPDSRIIFIVGRESKVCGTPFYNGELVSEIARQTIGCELLIRQERVFTNRFGQSIFEDILHFSPPLLPTASDVLENARNIALETLKSAYRFATPESKALIHAALEFPSHVLPSPYFDRAEVYTSTL